MTEPAERSERHTQAALQPMYRGQKFELPDDGSADIVDGIRIPGRAEPPSEDDGDDRHR
jgi:hypothetical protein